MSAIDLSAVAPIDTTGDTDSDGVDDVDDDYPNDRELAFRNYYPSLNQNGTLLFEDLWPNLGDYDFNDLVLQYNFVYITSSTGDLREIEANFKIMATGAGHSNGFALRLPIAQEFINSVEGQEIALETSKLNLNGTESGSNEAIIIVSDSVNHNFPSFANVYNGSVSPKPINIKIKIKEGINLNQTGLPPFDPFLIKDGQRDVEIHQMVFGPTELGSTNFFGKSDDQSNTESGIYYRTINYMPWVLNVPSELPHSKERIPLYNSYNKFMIWASSNGTYYQDWYQDKEGYINHSKVIKVELDELSL
jgi:LruC domain-containing protein